LVGRGHGALPPDLSSRTVAGRTARAVRRFHVSVIIVLVAVLAIGATMFGHKINLVVQAVDAAMMAARQPALALRLAQLDVGSADSGERIAFAETLTQLEHEHTELVRESVADAGPVRLTDELRRLYLGPGYGLDARLHDLFSMAHRLDAGPWTQDIATLVASIRQETIEQVVVRLSRAAELHQGIAMDRLHRLTRDLVLAVVCGLMLSLLALLAWTRLDRWLRRNLGLLERLAARDPLTGVLTRGAFTARLYQMLKGASVTSGVGIVAFDLDNFQALNAQSGNAAGDAALRAVARRLQQAAGRDAMVARFGSNAVAVAVAVADISDGYLALARTAERLSAALRDPVVFNGQILRIEVSGGSVLAPQDSANRSELLRMAGVALREAKREVKGSVHAFYIHDSALQARREAVLRALTEDDLRGVVPWLQPLVSAGDLMPVRFEVLARWEHPTLGRMTPDEFLPIAEAVGRLPLLSAHVRNEAFMMLADLRRTWATEFGASADETQGPGISVNLAPSEMAMPGTLPAMERALAAAGLPLRLVTIEVREEMLVDGTDEATLQALRQRGARLDLDNFGSGFGSLKHLRRFPVDGLKIERSFISAIGSDMRAEAIIRAVCGLGRGLGIETIAEGVETQAQLDFVRAAGCDVIQGYFIAAPMPAKDIPAWIRKTRTRPATG
jgi:diguanylate cyclase (GGDEF)-like protein